MKIMGVDEFCPIAIPPKDSIPQKIPQVEGNGYQKSGFKGPDSSAEELREGKVAVTRIGNGGIVPRQKSV
ncbi:hypothetical protein AKJ65_03525 [candidate division MSBL1 archaeon SCGC-AAA259E19]|uniref:Uncharacterized protein n=1 Tax=candidate division MSBL1 archaeon SCGC-AAA259E19 TaxID=1698264 RepID=A0A133UKN3_9EURY|nr:hypothetical protein AKJ65_03525 [candidate division MSBL1 archaeon SCGC-AAA259E19]